MSAALAAAVAVAVGWVLGIRAERRTSIETRGGWLLAEDSSGRVVNLAVSELPGRRARPGASSALFVSQPHPRVLRLHGGYVVEAAR